MSNFTPEPIPLNWLALQNLSPPEFNFNYTSPQQFLNDLSPRANELSNDWLASIVLVTLAIYLIWIYSDKSPYGNYRYNIPRALGIALGQVIIMGIVMVSIGVYQDILMVFYMGAVWIFILIYIIAFNPS